MPTYEYQCGTCGNRFDKYQSFSDEPVKICPECGNSVKKVVSAAGIIFKGSGWYINDSKPESKKAAAAPVNADKSSDTSSTSSDTPGTSTEATKDKESTKTESTPAATPGPTKTEAA